MTLQSSSHLIASPWQLGAPLYMPAHRPDLIAIANGEKLPYLRTMIFCTEDAILNKEIEHSLGQLKRCLAALKTTAEPRFRFIRVRHPNLLTRLLQLPGIETIDGFVLPKFNEAVFNAYFDQLAHTNFKIMPTLETKEVFDVGAMQALRDALLQETITKQVLMLRIGGNDLFNLLGIRRTRGLTLYDTPLAHVIAQLLTIFKPYDFHLSAPVFDYLDDIETLRRELRIDLAYGLTGKTAIHPEQVALIESAYAVSADDYQMALSICAEQAPAVFKMHNAMCEVTTHQRWARDVLNRQRSFGVIVAGSIQQDVCVLG